MSLERPASEKPKILVVDDEPRVVEGLARSLRNSHAVRTATSGEEGLAALGAEPDCAIVVSDMRMPKMNGAVFLAKASATAPDAVRILLTGQADMDDAISAINEGHIFRFLKKPCDPATLQRALADAYALHRAMVAEKVLLEQTLRGAVQALCDTLALASPASFGVATRVKRIATTLATRLEVKDPWRIELAAMVSQLGAVTVPQSVFERRARGEALTNEEAAMLARIPEVTDRLLAPIPRLEDVRAFVRAAQLPNEASAPIEAKILRVAMDFDELEVVTGSAERAIEALHERHVHYDPAVLNALSSQQRQPETVIDLPLSAIREGMIVGADVRTKGGMLLVARGHEVTASLLGRLANFASTLETKTVQIVVRQGAAANAVA